MSKFNYQDYQKAVERMTALHNQDGKPAAKIGYFRLHDGDEAIVRFDISSIDDVDFEIVHKPAFKKSWTGLKNPYANISCLNELGHKDDKCPFCRAAAEGHDTISKAKKVCFVKLIASYKDRATGQWSAPQAVVWEQGAGFSHEIASKLSTYGDLRTKLFKIARHGADMTTTYSIDYAPSEIFKPEMIPQDFSAFDGFDIAAHSFWKKSADEMNEFIQTGSFPAFNPQADSAISADVSATPSTVQPASVAPAATLASAAAPSPDPTPAESHPKFGGFSF